MAGVVRVPDPAVCADEEDTTKLVRILYGHGGQKAFGRGTESGYHHLGPQHLARRTASQSVGAVEGSRRIRKTAEGQALAAAECGSLGGLAHRHKHHGDIRTCAYLVTQLRGQLAAKRSAVVAEKGKEHRPLLPQGGQGQLLARRIRHGEVWGRIAGTQRNRGHGARILLHLPYAKPGRDDLRRQAAAASALPQKR